MPEVSTPAQLVVVDYACDHCEEGQMLPDNITLTSFPPQYPHVCNKCGHKAVFKERFPTTRIIKQPLNTEKEASNVSGT